MATPKTHLMANSSSLESEERPQLERPATELDAVLCVRCGVRHTQITESQPQLSGDWGLEQEALLRR